MAKQIPLGGYPMGKCVTVDDEDYDLLRRWNWTILEGRYTYYARRNGMPKDGEKKTSILLHRYLMKAPKGTEVDHLDNNGLNCTRGNLRVGPPADNRIRMVRRLNRAEYQGVYRNDSIVPKWSAKINYQGVLIHLGSFNTPEEAHEAYLAKRAEILAGIGDERVTTR